MFGFTPLATTTLASSVSGVSAEVPVTGVVATGAVSTVIENVTERLASVSATGAVGTPSINPDEVTNSVSATTAVGTVTVNVSELLASVAATGTVVTVGFDAKGNHTLASVSATGSIEPVSVGGFEVDISENLLSVSATGTVGSLTVNISELLNSVTATGTITNVIPSGEANQTLVGVSASGAVEAVSFDGFEIDISEKVLSVSATGTVANVKTNITEVLNSVAANTNVGSLVATGVTFSVDINAFDKDRVIYAVAVPRENVVHIRPDNRTIVINEISRINQTIRVAA